MNKSTNQHESISAMADGEMSDAQLDSLLASLNEADSKDAWEIYHQIGDVLRSEELAITFSADFSKRFSERLDAEPVILAPTAMQKNNGQNDQGSHKKQKFLGTYAAVASMAAAAVFAFVMIPQIQSFQASPDAASQIISKAPVAGNVQLAKHAEKPGVNTLAVKEAVTQSPQSIDGSDKKPVEIDMLRDPRIDSYLLAHQRFSPAINNGAQYVTHANAVSSASEK
ncbi:sigma-E factor negative regulatory protein [Undibacterium umbellatum]|uniref:Sigma-E factor negative regulatory protein n=1 Tax=Undibacterium umbellatum TaxID=2762300 RepID=A0ABR6Z3B9_9BURK|nr:sigma-E factor negative regulatory protein [Undibacterium umbellatum]MBC3906113.1 sigma-E factor negative regulatory protein [Undibacterium umbellatum]